AKSTHVYAVLFFANFGGVVPARPEPSIPILELARFGVVFAFSREEAVEVVLSRRIEELGDPVEELGHHLGSLGHLVLDGVPRVVRVPQQVDKFSTVGEELVQDGKVLGK